MALIDYSNIQEDLAELVRVGPSAGYTVLPKKVFIEAMEREQVLDNMPLLNIRLIDAEI